jgi:phosphomannomutase
VGDALVHLALEGARFTSVTSVPEQRKPDGAFPTVTFPNPEEPGTMDRAFALAREIAADLVLANDPDADRLAVAVPVGSGDGPRAFRQLTGNEVGVLLGHYLLTERPATRPRAVVTSIVSSPLLGRIAADLGVRYEETLTGFKWISHRAMAIGREESEFVFGYEEALGYAVGDIVYDKDGVSAAAVFAEMAAVLRERGQTPLDALDVIARRWGLFTSAQVSVTRKGAAGMLAVRTMMESLRTAPPERIGGDEVVAVADYEARARWDRRQGSRTELTLPKSNVVALELASGGRVIARPSGTEPKAKFYFDVREEVAPGEAVAAARTRAEAVLSRLKEAFALEVAPLLGGSLGRP